MSELIAPSVYRVNELFSTIQGEGVHMGRTATFIRLQGCPVGCPWCDSKTTWYNGGYAWKTDELVNYVADNWWDDLVVITGGEPCMFNLDPLIRGLREAYRKRFGGHLGPTTPHPIHFKRRDLTGSGEMDHKHLVTPKIHIETSGHFGWKGGIYPDFVTLSPKYGHTMKRHWYVDPSIYTIMSLVGGEFKFVVDDEFKVSIVDRILLDYYEHWREQGLPQLVYDESALPVYLMPEGAPPTEEHVRKTVEVLKAYPKWRFGPRLQYAYSAIEKLEGRNNVIITPEEGRESARRDREAASRP
jgi:hypothetical protein